MDKRFLLAIVLSAAVLWLWFGLAQPLVFPRKPAPLPDPAAENIDPENPPKPADPGLKPSDPVKPQDPADPAKPGPAPEKPLFEPTLAPARFVEISNDLLSVEFSSEGAVLSRLVLQRYLDPGRKEKYPLLHEIEAGVRSFVFSIEGMEELGLRHWEVESHDPARSVTFRYRTGTGLVVRKTFSFDDGPCATPYTLKMSVDLSNSAQTLAVFIASLTGPAGVPEENPEQPAMAAYVATGLDRDSPTIEELSPAKVAETPKLIVAGRTHYAGIGNKYFGVALVILEPESGDIGGSASIEQVAVRGIVDSGVYAGLLASGKAEGARKKATVSLQPVFRFKEASLAAGGEGRLDFLVYAGPKIEDNICRLRIQGIRTTESSFCFPASWTRALGWVILQVLLFFNSIIGNYGISIILLTIVVRALMVPLSVKMQFSMQEYQIKMRKIQPRMQEIKEKYKDKQRQQQEMTKLMREHGLSILPLKGCLPILLQFPIFIALFYTLRNSLELRHAPFLYIADLASPDRLFQLPDFIPAIPLVGGLIGGWFNLLPVLWIALMILQQKITPVPKNEDPQMASQRKMMLFMSAIFGVLFFKIESGCAIYIIVSTLWGMGEGYLIRRQIAALDTPA